MDQEHCRFFNTYRAFIEKPNNNGKCLTADYMVTLTLNSAYNYLPALKQEEKFFNKVLQHFKNWNFEGHLCSELSSMGNYHIHAVGKFFVPKALHKDLYYAWIQSCKANLGNLVRFVQQGEKKTFQFDVLQTEEDIKRAMVYIHKKQEFMHDHGFDNVCTRMSVVQKEHDIMKTFNKFMLEQNKIKEDINKIISDIHEIEFNNHTVDDEVDSITSQYEKLHNDINSFKIR